MKVLLFFLVVTALVFGLMVAIEKLWVFFAGVAILKIFHGTKTTPSIQTPMLIAGQGIAARSRLASARDSRYQQFSIKHSPSDFRAPFQIDSSGSVNESDAAQENVVADLVRKLVSLSHEELFPFVLFNAPDEADV